MSTSNPSPGPLDSAERRPDHGRRWPWAVLAGLVVLVLTALTVTEFTGMTRLTAGLLPRAGGQRSRDGLQAGAGQDETGASADDALNATGAGGEIPAAVDSVDLEQAIAEKQKTIRTCERIAAAEPENSEAQSRLASALADLAAVFRSRKQFHDARPLLERAVRLHKGAWIDHPERDDFRNFLAAEMLALAETLLQSGNYSDAARIAEELPRSFPADWLICQHAANCLFQCVGLVSRDGQLTETDRTDIGRSYLQLARDLLREAVSRGADGVAGAWEAEVLEVIEFDGCSPWPQMGSSRSGRWSNGFRLWCRSDRGGFVVLEVAVPKSGSHQADVYMTPGPDCGIVEFSLDDVRIGEAFDGFSTAASSSRKVELGVVNLTAGKHRLRFQAVGKHDRSSGYSFGIDCVTLNPIAE